MPIENSTDGRVADTLDMFARLPARICGRCNCGSITICWALRCGRVEVYSKPQALSQCQWLARHLPATDGQ